MKVTKVATRIDIEDLTSNGWTIDDTDTFDVITAADFASTEMAADGAAFTPEIDAIIRAARGES